MHSESDSLEEWFKDEVIRDYYSWFPAEAIPTATPTGLAASSTALAAPPGAFPVPGDLLYPPANADACARIMATSFTGSTGRYDDPVVGESATLPALLLTGVGDHDADGIRDRKLKFDKAAFVEALGGQTGNLPSVIRGGLLPGGQPRFLAPFVVSVFRPGHSSKNDIHSVIRRGAPVPFWR